MSTQDKEPLKTQSVQTWTSKIRGPLGKAKEQDVLVVLSGGQDSTTSLFWAKKNFKNVEAIFFKYGQRHYDREFESVAKIASIAGVTVHTADINMLSKSALLEKETKIDDSHSIFKDLPASFVPLRNLMLLSYASQFALIRGIPNIVTGVCQTDYSGYPDCRQEFILSLENTINMAIGRYFFTIWTPLMYLTKAETVVMAKMLGDDCWEALGYTTTCYEGKYPPCTVCPACILRAKGFVEAGYDDPLFR